MEFKRKQQRSVRTGDICKIKEDVKLKMKDNQYYRDNSVSEKSRLENGYIYERCLRKGITNNKAMVEDSSLLYIKGVSAFSKDILEVFPIKIEFDVYNYAVTSLIKKRNTFFIRRNSLYLSSKADSEIIFEGSYTQQKVRALIEDIYDITL